MWHNQLKRDFDAFLVKNLRHFFGRDKAKTLYSAESVFLTKKFIH